MFSRTKLLVAALAAFAFLPSAFAGAPSTSKYNSLLGKYVSGGKVDYEGLRGDRAALDDYVKAVSTASGDLKLAFYLNAYNAIVLQQILDFGPTIPKDVLKDIKGLFDSKKFTVAGKSVTLNDLEGYARKTFKDPRVHFAFNCGARSCPPLYNKAFDDATVDRVLEDLTVKFLNGSGVKVNETKKEIQVTKLFDWYKTDFTASSGTVEDYLKKYVTESTRKAALDAPAGTYKITFQGYNWAPNAK